MREKHRLPYREGEDVVMNIRINRHQGFTSIPNEILCAHCLSIGTLDLLCPLPSRPGNARIAFKVLQRKTGLTEDGPQRLFGESNDAGYVAPGEAQ